MLRMTLEAARRNKRMTQTEAASEIGVSVSTLKNWERGKSFPKQPQIERICDVYGTSYDDLIFLT